MNSGSAAIAAGLVPSVAGAIFDATRSASSTMWLAGAMAIGSIVALLAFRTLHRWLDPRRRE